MKNKPNLSKKILTRNLTSARRQLMQPICFQLKIQQNKATKTAKSKDKSQSLYQIQQSLTQYKKLGKYFKLSKYLKNDIIGCADALHYKTNINNINVKFFKDKILQSKNISIADLPSHIKQAIHSQVLTDISNLSKAKKKGNKVGKLKFCKQLNCITLKQFKKDWDFKGKNKVRITGIGTVKVNGLEQFNMQQIVEWGMAKLIKKPSGIYLHILGFKSSQFDNSIIKPEDCIGLDFGIKDSIVLSNGQKFDLKIQIPTSLKKAQRKLQKSQLINKENKKIHSIKCGKNQFKLKCKLQKEWQKYKNQKKDLSNKFVSYLTSNYKSIIIQDQSIKGWHSGLFGRQVQIDCLGRVKTKIMNLDSSIVIDKFEPSSQLCHCGNKNKLSLEDRVYSCCCGHSQDRDIKSAKMILCLGLDKKYLKESVGVPAERRDFKLQEIISSTIEQKWKHFQELASNYRNSTKSRKSKEARLIPRNSR